MHKTLMRASAAVAGIALAAQAAVPLAFASVPSSVSINAPNGTTPYSTIEVSGSGFSPGEEVEVLFGLSQATTTADAQGNFANVPVVVPDVSSGTYVVLALGLQSGNIGFSYFFVGSFYPLVSPSSWWTAPGTTVTFSGSGFAPGEQVSIALAGSSTPATVTADSNGSFTGQAPFVIPYALRNSKAQFTVTAARSGYSDTIAVGVGDLYPWTNPSAWYILPGSAVTFSGGGFGPNEGISIYYATSTSALVHTSADATGAFAATTSVTIPYGTGVADYKVKGDASGAVVDVPITRATFYPSLSPSAYYSAPGGSISLSGSGFVPNEVVNISLGTTGSTTATADGTGAFSIQNVHLPAVGGEQIPITAVGATSGATASFQMTMGQYYTWVVLSSYWAEGGTALTVTGHNFAPGESVILSSVNGPFASTTADGSGDFTAAATVPYAPSGDIAIMATGATSNAPASVHMTVAPVYTDIELKNYAGAPGSTVEFIGKGYVPNDTVVVTSDRTGSTPIATIQADGNGSFDDTSFSIPAGWTEGNLTFTIKGTKSFDSKSIVYYVTGS